MARREQRAEPTREVTLEGIRRSCPACGTGMWNKYDKLRAVTTLNGVVRLRLKVRRCENIACERYHKPYRPEAEGRWALPWYETGLDVIAKVGALRYQEHRSVPEIHVELVSHGVQISERTVTNLLERYDELVALRLQENSRLQKLLQVQGRVILAIDGLQPDVGHEVLWVLRDCLSGEVLLAQSLLSATHEDIGQLIERVKVGFSQSVSIDGVISDGQRPIRKAVAKHLPGVPHGLCHYHYLREAALEIYEADRHAKKELKKRVRGVRPIERSVEGRQDVQASVIRDYCTAVRAAITDDGRPPLAASGLRLHERMVSIQTSLDRVAKRGLYPQNW